MYSNTIIKQEFSINNLNKIFYEKVNARAVSGIDRVNSSTFEKNITNNLYIINNKVFSNKYSFTRYKKILISKGEGKNPRVINIPTIRDRITLIAMNECLNLIYKKTNCSKLPHIIINEIKESINSNNYDTFIKYDIKSFYQNIDHNILTKKICKKFKNQNLCSLIVNAIETSAVELPIKEKVTKNIRHEGIPEGLNISNSLANIYLLDLDRYMGNIGEIKYFRYIDDILILCNNDTLKKVEKAMNRKIKKLKLKFNEKCDKGKIADKHISYLGYEFVDKKITVRNSSIYKLENNIEKIIAEYKYSTEKNIDLLIWRLNLKITGCISNNNKYGWLFFFSQINDLELLNHLDWLVKKILLRYDLNIDTKKFVRSYHEITKSLHKTNYIPNFGHYCFENKIYVIEKIYKKNIDRNNVDLVNRMFDKIVFNDINLLEKDIQQFS